MDGYGSDDEVRRIVRGLARRIVEKAGRCCREEVRGVVELVEASELRDALRTCRVVLVFFYTPACPFCRALAPIYEEAAEYYSGKALFAKLNLARMPFVADALGILGTPTIIVYVGGREAGRMVGMIDGARLEAAVEAALRMAGCPVDGESM